MHVFQIIKIILTNSPAYIINFLVYFHILSDGTRKTSFCMRPATQRNGGFNSSFFDNETMPMKPGIPAHHEQATDELALVG